MEYESILVAFEDNDYSPEAVSTAVRLPAARRGIHVLVTISVPPNSPIDASMPEHERKAASVIDQARVLGGRRVTGHWEKVRPGRRRPARRGGGEGDPRPRHRHAAAPAAHRLVAVRAYA